MTGDHVIRMLSLAAVEKLLGDGMCGRIAGILAVLIGLCVAGSDVAAQGKARWRSDSLFEPWSLSKPAGRFPHEPAMDEIRGRTRNPAAETDALPSQLYESAPTLSATNPQPGHFTRRTVDYFTHEPIGTVIVDTDNTSLYLVLGNGKALRYRIGVGREGFTWSGRRLISRMAEWPDWHPPPEMVERQPELPRFMAGGIDNPLGARALYLGNTLFRIHGTSDASSIGNYVSSGCIRLLNEDIEDLYRRVHVGTRVVVLRGGRPRAASARR